MSSGLWLVKAERLLKTAMLASDDGDADSACNRAYYAMFNAARAALISAGREELAAAKTHSGLISAFGEHIVKTGFVAAEHGRALATESRRRLVGDYEGDGMALADAEMAIDHARAFIEAITIWCATAPSSEG